MPKAIVIGGGFGGMAAALRVRAKGYSVTLIDRCEKLGGRAQVFEREGFRFDAGPTVVTAPFLFDELIELYNVNIKNYINIVPVEPWYRFVYPDGSSFDYSGDMATTLEQIHAIEPKDVEGYQKLLAESEKIFDIGFSELADQPFHQFSKMMKQLPSLVRLKSYRSVWDLVSKYLSHDKLRQAFSIQPLLVGGNPFDTTCIYNLIHFLERKWGIHFAMGGTGAIVAGLSKLMDEVGIDVELNTTIDNIEILNGQARSVEAEDGRRWDCDLLVSNMDPTHLYGKLIPKQDQKLSARIKTRHSALSMGLYVLFFGTQKQYSDIAHHTIWLGKRYQGLLDDIFHNKILADDFSLYLHRPTATDPSFAPDGCDSFYVLAPVPNLAGDVDWSHQEQEYGDRIIESLEKTIMPGLSENICHRFAMTPANFKQDYLSTQGAGFSVAPLLQQSAWFRYHNKSEGVSNLYLVGAGTHPGAGLPGVLSSAKVLEHLVEPVQRRAS